MELKNDRNLFQFMLPALHVPGRDNFGVQIIKNYRFFDGLQAIELYLSTPVDK